MDLLREQRKLDRYSSWTRTKEEIRDDPRYQAIESSSTKEDYFREYCSKLSKSSSNNDRGGSDRGRSSADRGGGERGKSVSEAGERSDSEERQKKERIEASLRQREKEVAETLSSSLKQRDREREMHRREEAVQSFQALLTDLVRTSDMSWHDAKKMLKKDHRYAGSREGGLDKAERERLFDEHVSQLKRKKKDKFKLMLAECGDITLNMPFSDVSTNTISSAHTTGSNRQYVVAINVALNSNRLSSKAAISERSCIQVRRQSVNTRDLAYVRSKLKRKRCC
ncbi:transcription elongation regulator 1-like [Varroa destructor]|uniref:FF domain-containing protein n=1 Tax=Varroa destructor TaxID=109461 RepID=A0A7M7KA00_VARDE|nr:transcription elongation regulator 1-like [Varroa destructor]